MVLSEGNKFVTQLLKNPFSLLVAAYNPFLFLIFELLISGFPLLLKFFIFFDSGDSVHQKENKSNPTAEHSDFL